MYKTIIALAAVLSVASTAAAGPGAPACYACFCGSASGTPQYCRLIEENDDYPPTLDACSSTCGGSFVFQYVLAGNFCPSPPCPTQSYGAPAMHQGALALAVLALLSLGGLYLRRRNARS
jgi:hypothetical protein